MNDDQTQLSNDDIRRLLIRLDEDLWEHNQEAIIYVVGGANIALAIDTRRTTTDIDLATRNRSPHGSASRPCLR